MKMFFDIIIFKYFITAFAIGIFLVYISTPQPEIIIQYPLPDKAQSLVYEDDGGKCFQLLPQEVQCNGDDEEFPIQQHSSENINQTSAVTHIWDKYFPQK